MWLSSMYFGGGGVVGVSYQPVHEMTARFDETVGVTFAPNQNIQVTVKRREAVSYTENGQPLFVFFQGVGDG